MTRGLPYSIGVHILTLVLVILFGNRVSQVQPVVPRSIKVRMVQLPKVEPTPETQVIEQAPVQAPPEIQPELPPKELPKPKPEEKKPEPEVKKPEPKVEQPPAEEPVKQDELPTETPTVAMLPSGPSVAGTDIDFPFAWYLSRVEGLIARNWKPRQLGFGQKAVVTCAVHFVITRNGSVGRVSLTEGSGVGVYDREAIRAVQTTRMPPLPPQYTGSTLGVTFIFNLEPGT